jgi:hypothetical protein
MDEGNIKKQLKLADERMQENTLNQNEAVEVC